MLGRDSSTNILRNNESIIAHAPIGDCPKIGANWRQLAIFLNFELLAPFGATWRHVAPFILVPNKWRQVAPNGAKWRQIELNWRHLAPFSATWRHLEKILLVPFGANWRQFWRQMALSGAKWRQMAPKF